MAKTKSKSGKHAQRDGVKLPSTGVKVSRRKK